MIYIVGIVLGKMEIESLFVTLCFLGLGIILLYPKKRILLVLLIFSFLLGYGTTFLQMSKNSQLEPLHNQTIGLQACVLEPPIEKENKTDFYLEIQQIEVEGKSYILKEKVLASLYYNEGKKKYSKMNLSPGEVIDFQGKIKIPKEMRNPGGFDYALYLRSKKIYAAITIKPETIQVLGQQSLGRYKELIYQIKDRVEKSIDQNLSKDHGDLLKGILFGEKSLDSEIRDSFVDTGIAHVLAVSGLHVGFMISFISAISKILKLPNPIKFIFFTLALIFYILITGGSPSVIRASIMAWISLFSKIISKNYDGVSALSLAGLIILLPNPFILYTASFQLSFLASGAIILFYSVFLEYLQRIPKIPNFISSTLAVTLAAQIGTLPASLYHFHQVSIISVITNLIVVPLIGLLVMGSIIAILFCFFTPFIGRYLFFLMSFVFQFVIEIAGFFSSFPYASIFLPSLNWRGVVLYIFLFFIIGRYIPLEIKKVRVLSFMVIGLILAFAILSILIPSPLKVTFLDVSQGDSILIETPNGKNILIDGGGYAPYQGKERKVSEEVLLPAFYSKRIHKLDLVIVSHPHDDHIKGIEELIGKIPIDAIGIYPMDHEYVKNLKSLATNEKIKMIALEEGNVLKIQENLTMKVLSPAKGFSIEDQQKDVNNSSLVLRLDYYQSSFLFTGDIEEEMENQLLATRKDLKTDVLKVAHHGSDSSSSENFIKRVHPNMCVISVGKNNTFGHPSPYTIKQLRKVTPCVYRTDENGAVEITTNGSWIKVKSYLEQ